MSAGCNLLLSRIQPFKELSIESLFAEKLKIIEHPECMCNLIDTPSSSIKDLLMDYLNTTIKEKKKISLKVREIYEKRHAKFIESFKIPEYPVYSLNDTLQKESDLPDVSIRSEEHTSESSH
jgi:hypothetical protein